MRLIKADDVYELFNGNATTCIHVADIDLIPRIDAVKVIHAHWKDIYGGKYANPRYACSSCGGKALWNSVQDELLSWHEVQVLSDFCPHCGAKMDGGVADG